MQGDILYERSTTLPNIRGHFHRPRIDKLLDELLNRQLIVVTAGAGWGKTHAVASFLNNAQVRVIWFQLSELDNHLARFWEEFVYIIEFQNKETAAQLAQVGFPDTLPKLDRFLHILAKEVYSREQVVFVLDDFHLIYDESILHFIENLISAKLENFCIIVNCRKPPSFNLTSMLANGLAGRLTAEELHFTQEETDGYLRQHDITLSTLEYKKVQSVTEGWPLALYLIGLSMKKDAIVLRDPISGAIPLIFEMIEKEMFSGYTPPIQSFLIRASLVSSFHEALIKELAEDCFESAIEILDSNMFIYYNPYTRHYNFHHLFLEFLKEKQRYLTHQEITKTYLDAAAWCIDNDLKIEALKYYDKCGSYDKAIEILANYGTATFPKTTADFLIEIIDRFPEELVKNNPMAHVLHAGLLLNNAEFVPAIEELINIQGELEALPPTEGTREVLGNIYCMLGLISIGSCNYDFVELFKNASECLKDGGLINSNGKPINTKYSIMLSSPEPGELKRMEDALFYAIPYASKAMHGYAHGMDYLASAEAAYFTGDMKKAFKNAYEAIYRARNMQVSDVASSGYFLLMRIEASNGKYDSVFSNLEQLKTYVESLEDKWNFNGMYDVAEGWFNLMVGRPEKVASWIVDNSVGGSVLAPYSMGMERLIKAKYLLKEGKYYELLAWLEQGEEQFREDNNKLILLDILIYKSIASHQINEHIQAAEALKEAYEISHGNGIIMQFIELGNDIRAVIHNIKRNIPNTIPDIWLDEIYTKASTYEKHIRNMKSHFLKASATVPSFSVKLTKRENELLGYLCQGLTNSDIASTCFITVSAVKKTLNNIYIKLGATNRADAVRIAMLKGICI